MSGTGSGLGGLNTLIDPASSALLGLAGTFAQAAAPSIYKQGMGALLGQGAQGLQQGLAQARSGQLQQQQLQAQQLANQQTQIGMPLVQARTNALMSLFGGAPGMGGIAGSPPAGGNGAPGMAGMVGSGGGPTSMASFGGAGGMPPSAGGGAPPSATGSAAPGGLTGMLAGGPPAAGVGGMAGGAPGGGGNPLMSTSQLMNSYRIALASGDDRAAAAILQNIQSQAGGQGYSMQADGTSAPTTGGSADPGTVYRRAAADAAGSGQGGLGPKEALASYQGGVDATVAGVKATLDKGVHAANAGVDAGYAPPVEMTVPDGQGGFRNTYVPRTSLPGLAAGSGSGGGTPAGSPGAAAPMTSSSLAQRINASENSTGNASTGNMSGPGGTPTSGAVGDGQFTMGTFVPLFRQSYPSVAANMSDSAIAALRSDRGVSQDMTSRLIGQNAPILSRAGVQPTSGALAIAHKLGPQGAIAVLQAPITAPLSSVLPPAVMQANPQLTRMTVGGYRGSMFMQFGNAPVSLAGSGGSGGAGTGAGAGSPNSPALAGAPSLPGAVPGAPVFTPEGQKNSEALGDQQTTIRANAATAGGTLRDLDILQSASDNFRTGSSGGSRIAAGKALVDAFGSVGISMPASLVNSTANGEAIAKTGMDLAINRTRQLGSREAGFVLQMVRSNLPNEDMSQAGFGTVINALRQSALHDQDLDTFRQSWVQQHGSWEGGQAAFDQSHPPEAYASRVIPFALSANAATSSLKPNVIYKSPSGGLATWNGSGMVPVPKS